MSSQDSPPKDTLCHWRARTSFRLEIPAQTESTSGAVAICSLDAIDGLGDYTALLFSDGRIEIHGPAAALSSSSLLPIEARFPGGGIVQMTCSSEAMLLLSNDNRLYLWDVAVFLDVAFLKQRERQYSSPPPVSSSSSNSAADADDEFDDDEDAEVDDDEPAVKSATNPLALSDESKVFESESSFKVSVSSTGVSVIRSPENATESDSKTGASSVSTTRPPFSSLNPSGRPTHRDLRLRALHAERVDLPPNDFVGPGAVLPRPPQCHAALLCDVVPSTASIAQIAAGHMHYAAVTADGRLCTWGLNHKGQLGRGAHNALSHWASEAQKNSIVELSVAAAPIVLSLNPLFGKVESANLPPLSAVAATASSTLSPRTPTSASANFSPTAATHTNNQGVSFQPDHEYHPPDWVRSPLLALPSSSDSFTSSSSSSPASTSSSSSSAAEVPDRRVVSVACGLGHTLIVRADGRALACGWNLFGQLGLGHHRPIVAEPTVIQAIARRGWRVNGVAAGGAHSLFLIAGVDTTAGDDDGDGDDGDDDGSETDADDESKSDDSEKQSSDSKYQGVTSDRDEKKLEVDHHHIDIVVDAHRSSNRRSIDFSDESQPLPCLSSSNLTSSSSQPEVNGTRLEGVMACGLNQSGQLGVLSLSTTGPYALTLRRRKQALHLDDGASSGQDDDDESNQDDVDEDCDGGGDDTDKDVSAATDSAEAEAARQRRALIRSLCESTPRMLPTFVNQNVVSLQAGWVHSAALRANGQAFVWGQQIRWVSSHHSIGLSCCGDDAWYSNVLSGGFASHDGATAFGGHDGTNLNESDSDDDDSRWSDPNRITHLQSAQPWRLPSARAPALIEAPVDAHSSNYYQHGASSYVGMSREVFALICGHYATAALIRPEPRVPRSALTLSSDLAQLMPIAKMTTTATTTTATGARHVDDCGEGKRGLDEKAEMAVGLSLDEDEHALPKSGSSLADMVNLVHSASSPHFGRPDMELVFVDRSALLISAFVSVESSFTTSSLQLSSSSRATLPLSRVPLHSFILRARAPTLFALASSASSLPSPLLFTSPLDVANEEERAIMEFVDWSRIMSDKIEDQPLISSSISSSSISSFIAGVVLPLDVVQVQPTESSDALLSLDDDEVFSSAMRTAPHLPISSSSPSSFNLVPLTSSSSLSSLRWCYLLPFAVSAAAMRCFLSFLYTGSADLCGTSARDILQLSLRYRLFALRHSAEQLLVALRDDWRPFVDVAKRLTQRREQVRQQQHSRFHSSSHKTISAAPVPELTFTPYQLPFKSSTSNASPILHLIEVAETDRLNPPVASPSPSTVAAASAVLSEVASLQEELEEKLAIAASAPPHLAPRAPSSSFSPSLTLARFLMCSNDQAKLSFFPQLPPPSPDDSASTSASSSSSSSTPSTSSSTPTDLAPGGEVERLVGAINDSLASAEALTAQSSDRLMMTASRQLPDVEQMKDVWDEVTTAVQQYQQYQHNYSSQSGKTAIQSSKAGHAENALTEIVIANVSTLRSLLSASDSSDLAPTSSSSSPSTSNSSSSSSSSSSSASSSTVSSTTSAAAVASLPVPELLLIPGWHTANTHYLLAYDYAVCFARDASMASAAQAVTQCIDQLCETEVPPLATDGERQDAYESKDEVLLAHPRETLARRLSESELGARLRAAWLEALPTFSEHEVHAAADQFARAQAEALQTEQCEWWTAVLQKLRRLVSAPLLTAAVSTATSLVASAATSSSSSSSSAVSSSSSSSSSASSASSASSVDETTSSESKSPPTIWVHDAVAAAAQRSSLREEAALGRDLAALPRPVTAKRQLLALPARMRAPDEDFDVLVCGRDGRLLLAHRGILCCRSEYLSMLIDFASMSSSSSSSPSSAYSSSSSFQSSDNGELLPRLRLTQLQSAWPMLVYLYSGRLAPTSDVSALFELLAFADLATLFHWRDLLQAAILRALTPENACFCLTAADRFGSVALRAAVLHFILRHLRAVQRSEAFALLPLPLTDLIRRNLPQASRRLARFQQQQLIDRRAVASADANSANSGCVIA